MNGVNAVSQGDLVSPDGRPAAACLIICSYFKILMKVSGAARKGGRGMGGFRDPGLWQTKAAVPVHSSPFSRSNRHSNAALVLFSFLPHICDNAGYKVGQNPLLPRSSATCSQNDKPASSVWDKTHTHTTHCGMSEGVCQVLGRRPL